VDRQFLEFGKEMRASDMPPMTGDEIQAEIDAVFAYALAAGVELVSRYKGS